MASPKISLALARVSCLVCLCALSSLMLERNCENFSYDSLALAWRKNSLPSTLPPAPLMPTGGDPWPPTDGDVTVDECDPLVNLAGDAEGVLPYAPVRSDR